MDFFKLIAHTECLLQPILYIGWSNGWRGVQVMYMELTVWQTFYMALNFLCNNWLEIWNQTWIFACTHDFIFYIFFVEKQEVWSSTWSWAQSRSAAVYEEVCDIFKKRWLQCTYKYVTSPSTYKYVTSSSTYKYVTSSWTSSKKTKLHDLDKRYQFGSN